MDREELLQQMLQASTPAEISSAIEEGRAWLRTHPRDQQVALSILELLEEERSALRLSA